MAHQEQYFFSCVGPYPYLSEGNRKPHIDFQGTVEEEMFLCECIQVANTTST